MAHSRNLAHASLETAVEESSYLGLIHALILVRSFLSRNLRPKWLGNGEVIHHFLSPYVLTPIHWQRDGWKSSSRVHVPAVVVVLKGGWEACLTINFTPSASLDISPLKMRPLFELGMTDKGN